MSASSSVGTAPLDSRNQSVVASSGLPCTGGRGSAGRPGRLAGGGRVDVRPGPPGTPIMVDLGFAAAAGIGGIVVARTAELRAEAFIGGISVPEADRLRGIGGGAAFGAMVWADAVVRATAGPLL